MCEGKVVIIPFHYTLQAGIIDVTHLLKEYKFRVKVMIINCLKGMSD